MPRARAHVVRGPGRLDDTRDVAPLRRAEYAMLCRVPTIAGCLWCSIDTERA
jgi:hypothetical protein